MKANVEPGFTHVELFAGIGGFRLALDAAGGRCVGFSEIDRDAIATYCENFLEDPTGNLGNVTKITRLPPHDVLTAGVPCQSWSIAGRNLGFDDDRGQLWNDTLFLLRQAQPKAFIFENVKGLADPRNQEALAHIMERIRQAGYFARPLVINSSDYGVPQDRVRIYIVGFREKAFFDSFEPPAAQARHWQLQDVLGLEIGQEAEVEPGGFARQEGLDLFGQPMASGRRHSRRGERNDFFLFNDIRNGPTTIHSWDLKSTTERQKDICLLILRNRRKKAFGLLDGNPLSLEHLRGLDPTIEQSELEALVELGILKKVAYGFSAVQVGEPLSEQQLLVMEKVRAGHCTLDALREDRAIKLARLSLEKTIGVMLENGLLRCEEMRYEFRYTKISTGIDGINRIFLPHSKVFPTLVASDTNDFVALREVEAGSADEYKRKFLEEIFRPGLFRKISKEEACRIQGFPVDFRLPEARNRWMKLLGNSVSVPVIQALIHAIARTGCLGSAAEANAPAICSSKRLAIAA